MKIASTLFICLVSYVFGAVFQTPKPITVAGILGLEEASIKDPVLIENGYSCRSHRYNLAPMANGEVRRNFSPKICAEITCLNGTLTINGCGPLIVIYKCKIIEDRWSDYPDCCPKVECMP